MAWYLVKYNFTFTEYDITAVTDKIIVQIWTAL